MDEGVVRFCCDWTEAPPLPDDAIAPMRYWRRELHQKGWIGEGRDGIGFGNLSLRIDEQSFLVTGTQTGRYPDPGAEHYCIVDRWNVEGNLICCHGPCRASSESLTHAMFYELDPEIRAVIHIHQDQAWANLLGRIPTTSAQVGYGTPEMAFEIERLFVESALGHIRVAVMAGHPGGLLSFGADLEEAAQELIHWVDQSIK